MWFGGIFYDIYIEDPPPNKKRYVTQSELGADERPWCKDLASPKGSCRKREKMLSHLGLGVRSCLHV